MPPTPPPILAARPLVRFANRAERRVAAARRRRLPWRWIWHATLGGLGGFAAFAAGERVLAQQGIGDAGISQPGGMEGLPGSTLRDLAPARPAAPTAGASVLPEASRFDSSQPVTFTADEVEYDRDRGVVTARGRVEAWQGERVLRADTFSYDRNTEVAVLRGNVQLLEGDGQVFFADEAELGPGFRDGVLSGVRALMTQNARMAANGARRTGGEITDLSRVVYSSCNLCANDPSRPPLWQLRARVATQDRTTERISYRGATLQIGGVPVFYAPFFSHPDPQTPRASGFLFPTLGYTRFLGAFAQTPYYWAIDPTQDLLVTPLFSTSELPNLGLEYRRLFNNGELQVQGSVGYFQDPTLGPDRQIAGHIFARGRFAIDENWRVGFDGNRASSEQYLRTYRFEYRRVLTSRAFAEGFWGTEGYALLEARAYQGLRVNDDLSQTPYVTPNLFYERAPRRQVLGGFLTMDVGALGLVRGVGAYSQRQAVRIAWERPMQDGLGGLWTIRAQSDLRNYFAGGQEKLTNPLPSANGTHADANIRFALDWRMPFIRQGFGTQVIEPRVQVVTGPNTGRQTQFPNEDSIDFEFTDANLFALNRFTGRDRQEGGTRVDMALRGAWSLPNGVQVEGVAGRSVRMSNEAIFPANTGLDRRWSDWIGRATVAPTPWLNVTGRTRLDGETGRHRASDALATISLGSFGPLENVSVSAGYLYSPPLPFFNPPSTRNEVSAGLSGAWRSQAGGVWRAAVNARYDISLERPVLITSSFGYEDECFILEGRFLRRFAQDPVTRQDFLGNTVFLVRVGFKTVGDYFFRAI